MVKPIMNVFLDFYTNLKIIGMKINYWNCKFSDYVEVWDGEDEHRHYNCTHEKGCGTCNMTISGMVKRNFAN